MEARDHDSQREVRDTLFFYERPLIVLHTSSRHLSVCSSCIYLRTRLCTNYAKCSVFYL